MFSFQNGKAIARVEGGEHDGKTLHIYDPSSEKVSCCSKCGPLCLHNPCCSGCKYGEDGGCFACKGGEFETNNFKYEAILRKIYGNKSKKRLTNKDLDILIDAVLKGKWNKKVTQYDYNKGKDILEKYKKTELILSDGKMVPIPNPMETVEGDRIYIAGPTGSGKTSYARSFIKEYQRMFPGNDVFVFSRSEADPVLDNIEPKVKRIVINKELITNPIDLKELHDSLVLFDDVDAGIEKKLLDAVYQLRNDIVQNGRKYNIYQVNTSHQVTNYQKTRELLNDCQAVTFFPRAGSSYGIQYFLHKYCGLSTNQIQKILNLPSRWVTFLKRYPNCLLYEGGAYLLSAQKTEPAKSLRKIQKLKKDQVEDEDNCES